MNQLTLWNDRGYNRLFRNVYIFFDKEIGSNNEGNEKNTYDY